MWKGHNFCVKDHAQACHFYRHPGLLRIDLLVPTQFYLGPSPSTLESVYVSGWGPALAFLSNLQYPAAKFPDDEEMINQTNLWIGRGCKDRRMYLVDHHQFLPSISGHISTIINLLEITECWQFFVWWENSMFHHLPVTDAVTPTT